MLRKFFEGVFRKRVLKGLFVVFIMIVSLVPINAIGEPNFNNSNLTDRLINNLSNGVNIIHDTIVNIISDNKYDVIRLHPGDSIEEAVVNARDGDTILLDGGDYKTSSGIIAKNITLKASGVDGNPILSKKSNRGTIITLVGANFKLEGLTINGSNGSNGIMIRNNANATINNCNITNATNSVGGGLYVSFSNAIISGCNFVDNRVSGNGAGVYIDNYDGRDVYNVSINHCRFYNNKVSNNNSDSYDDVFVKELYDMDGNSLKDSINLDHNWWGSNTVNSTQTNVVPNDHYSTALYLNNNITANISAGFTDGDNVSIGYDLVLNTTNRTDNNNLLPYFPVKHNYINESIKDGREPYNISFKAKYLANQSFESVVDNQGLKIIIFSNIVDSIQELIDEAEPNTVIELPDGIYNKGSKDDSIRDCNLMINKPLTIKAKDDGHPVIDLTGKNTNGFKILSDNVRLEGLTVKGADFSGDGGAILSLGTSNTIIKSCTFANNKVLGDGGGIAILSGNNATIDNCTVVNNTATTGAGIHIKGGSNNIITNSNVLNNKAVDLGGGISLLFSTFVNITRSNIINNSAYRGGGFFISLTNVTNVNYNRILNNKNNLLFEEGNNFFEEEGVVNLDFNWWGTNDLTTKETNHIPEHYFIVNSSINKSNNTLNYVFNTNDNYPNNRSLLPYFNGFCISSDKNFNFDARDNQIFDLHQMDKVSIKVDNYEYNYTDPFESLSDIYVAFNGSNDNLGDINNPVADVNYAMNIVKPNGIIHLLTDLNITETINVTKNLKIKSDNGKLKLNGLNKTKIMNIVPGLTVNIESLHFINGFGLDGAGITNNESNLNINGCVFENNNVSGFGGAIASLHDYNKSTSNQIFTNQSRSKSPNQFNFRSSDYGRKLSTTHPTLKFAGINAWIDDERKLSTAHPTQENYLTINNSSFIKNNAYKGSAILSMSPEFNISYSNFTNNSLSQNTEVIVGINKKFNITDSSMLENSLDNIKEDDRLYVNTNLFLLDSTLNKGRYFIQGFVRLSQKSINEYKKDGYFKAHIGDNGHYMKCYNLDDDATAGDLVLLTSQDEVNLTQDIPIEHPGMLIGIGTVLGLFIVYCILLCSNENDAVMVVENIGAWMTAHKTLSKIIITIVSAGVGSLVTWLASDVFTGKESISTVTYVEMPENVYIGQTINIKIRVTTTDGDNIKDGNYKVKINNEEKILHFENGETNVNYTINRLTNNFVVEFLKNQYRQVESRKYYYDYSRYEPHVHYNKFNTTMEASSNVSSCRYNDTINIKFITSADIPVNGNYVIGVKEYTQNNYGYHNINFVNGVGYYNYTIKTRNWGWYPLRVDCIFNDSDMYFESGSYFMIDFDMSLDGSFNKYNHSFFAKRSYILDMI